MKVKLNEKYVNDFLVTTTGDIFYRKNNRINKEENIVDINLEYVENRQLLEQGILVVVDNESEEIVETDIKTSNEKNKTQESKIAVEKKVKTSEKNIPKEHPTLNSALNNK